MFEINRQPLITEVRCQECRASIEVNTDSRRHVEKSITKLQKLHTAGSFRNQSFIMKGSKMDNKKTSSDPILVRVSIYRL